MKFQDIVDLVTKHHDSKPFVVVQRYCFSTRSCCGGESISMYVAELHHLSEHCYFGTSLNKMLRDQIVYRIEDPKIQRQPLAEPQFTFDKEFELAVASESADKNAKDLQPAANFLRSLSISYNQSSYHLAITVEENTSVVTKLQSATIVVKLDT